MEKLKNKISLLLTKYSTPIGIEDWEACEENLALIIREIAINYSNIKLRELGLIDFGINDAELFNKFLKEQYGE